VGGGGGGGGSDVETFIGYVHYQSFDEKKRALLSTRAYLDTHSRRRKVQ
jgi:hypothetical protein